MAASLVEYGKGKYGAGAFFGAAGPLVIVGAAAVGPRVIRVRLSREPQHIKVYEPGDALCSQTWEVSRLDNGEPLTPVGARRFNNPVTWDIYLLTSMGGPQTRHQISSTTLRTAAGQPVGLPRRAEFLGVVAVLPANGAPAADRVVDLKNTAILGGGKGIELGDGGVYKIHGGTEALRKRILRCLTTQRGRWPGAPDRGFGLRVKDLLRSVDLRALKQQIQEEIARDPEVVSVEVRLRVWESGIAIDAQVRSRQGSADSFQFEFGDIIV